MACSFSDGNVPFSISHKMGCRHTYRLHSETCPTVLAGTCRVLVHHQAQCTRLIKFSDWIKRTMANSDRMLALSPWMIASRARLWRHESLIPPKRTFSFCCSYSMTQQRGYGMESNLRDLLIDIWNAGSLAKTLVDTLGEDVILTWNLSRKEV